MANAIILPPLPIVSASASSVALGDPNFVRNDYAGVLWQSGAAASSDLLLDLGRDVAVDTVMLFGVALAPAEATLQVFASVAAAGSGFSPPTWSGAPEALYAGGVAPVGDGVTLWTAPAGFPAMVRYLLLRFGTPSSTGVRVARAVIGKRIQFERNFGYSAAFGVRDLGSLDFSRRGVLQRARGKKLRTVGLTFSNVHKDEVEQQTRPLLERIGNTEMVALVTDPAAHAQRQSRCYFGPLVGDLGQTWRKANLFEAKVNLVSVF